MNILIRILLVLALLQWSLSCSFRHYKFVNRKINKKNNIKFPWLVAIRKNSPNIIFRLGYGSIIHPKAVLTAASIIEGYTENDLIVETKCRDIKRNLNIYNELFIYGCTTRHISKIVHQNNFNRKENLETSYAILILKTPFFISSKIHPILVANSTSIINEADCVFIRWMREWSQTSYRAGIINTPYKTSFFNQSFDLKRFHQRQLHTDRDWIVGQDFHLSHAHDDEFSVIPLNFVGSPLACKLKDDPKRYAQVGIATFRLIIYVKNNDTNSIMIKREGSLINVIEHKYEILRNLINNNILR